MINPFNDLDSKEIKLREVLSNPGDKDNLSEIKTELGNIRDIRVIRQRRLDEDEKEREKRRKIELVKEAFKEKESNPVESKQKLIIREFLGDYERPEEMPKGPRELFNMSGNPFLKKKENEENMFKTLLIMSLLRSF